MLRFCVDFRKINYITTKDAYPLPKLDDAFNALAGSRWYHIIDLKTGYWQIKRDAPILCRFQEDAYPLPKRITLSKL